MISCDEPQRSTEQERSPGVAQRPSDQRRQHQARTCTNQDRMSMLPAKQRIALQVGDRHVLLRLRETLEHPANVGVPEATGCIVGVGGLVYVAMMAAVRRCPRQRGRLK